MNDLNIVPPVIVAFPTTLAQRLIVIARAVERGGLTDADRQLIAAQLVHTAGDVRRLEFTLDEIVDDARESAQLAEREARL